VVTASVAVSCIGKSVKTKGKNGISAKSLNLCDFTLQRGVRDIVLLIIANILNKKIAG
jgi:hypothetical protein